MKINDKDIATIEMLHDRLLEEEIYDLNSDLLKNARKLTQKMYKELYK